MFVAVLDPDRGNVAGLEAACVAEVHFAVDLGRIGL